MYPHERSLVEKLKNRPFAIVGVNSDSDKAALRETLVKENITWRSFFDGGSTSGPIAREWNVSGWPTIYVLDAEGRIRFKNVRGEQLEAAIEALLAELEAGKAGGK
jgi:Thioredoxin-like